MKAGPHLKQTCHPSIEPDASLRRLRDPAENLEQCALARPVPPNDADHLSALHFERYILQRPEFLLLLPPTFGLGPEPAYRIPRHSLDHVAQTVPFFRLAPYQIALGNFLKKYDWFRHVSKGQH